MPAGHVANAPSAPPVLHKAINSFWRVPAIYRRNSLGWPGAPNILRLEKRNENYEARCELEELKESLRTRRLGRPFHLEVEMREISSERAPVSMTIAVSQPERLPLNSLGLSFVFFVFSIVHSQRTDRHRMGKSRSRDLNDDTGS